MDASLKCKKRWKTMNNINSNILRLYFQHYQLSQPILCSQLTSVCQCLYTIICTLLLKRKKGRDLTQSYDKSPYTSRNVKRARLQHNAKKSSITQRLRTGLGRSVGVTTATQLLWLTGLRAKPSHFPWNQKDKHLKVRK